MSADVINNHAAFIWSVADLLRGDYKQSEYGRVILPLTVLRRLDCVLEPSKAEMLADYERVQGRVENFGPILDKLTDIRGLWNISKLSLPKLLDDPNNVADNLRAYIHGFSPEARDILDKFDFATHITRLDKANLLYLVVSKFAEIDLHPDKVSNLEMGYLYEELIRRFSELSNETAGEHFTPREVIRLMVDLLFTEDDEVLSKPGTVKTVFDPACGTGGMLSISEEYVREHNPAASIRVFGQELNPETYAVCRSDMMVKGQDATNITDDNSFSKDGHKGRHFDYMLANPPFGVEWKKVQSQIKAEADTKGFAGRFGAGLPRINDGSFLFLQHMISKMKPVEEGGSRIAIVFNGSPLFTGAAGSGESEIRRWIIENDWLDAVVALPDQLFYNTGISTYFWIVTNRKEQRRRGKVQLIDARESWTKMRKSLGEKRKEISRDQIADIVRLYGDFAESDRSKIFANEEFGFLRITVERPLRLRGEVSDETLAVLEADKQVGKLDADEREQLLELAGSWQGESLSYDEVAKRIQGGLKRLGLTGKPLEKAVISALTITDPDAPVITSKGKPEADPDLRDYENVPLPSVQARYEADPSGRIESTDYRRAIDQYMTDEVLPYVPDSWVDYSKTKIGYEIPLTRHFYTYTPPRPLDQIDTEIKALEDEIRGLLDEVTT